MADEPSADREPGFDALSEDEVVAASSRSPTFDFAVIASLAGLRDTRGDVPLDSFVPQRTSVGIPLEMDRTTKLVLGNIDGARSIKAIARSARLPLTDTVAILFELLALGVIRCEEPASVQAFATE